jgi:hypothetical protein
VSDAPSLRAPLATRSLDGVVFVLAIFTLLAHATVWVGGSFDHLYAASVAVAGVAVAVAVALRWRGRGRSATGDTQQAPVTDGVGEPSVPWRAGLLGGAAAAAAAGWLSGSVTVWWAGALATTGMALLREARAPVADVAARRTRGTDALLVVLALLLAMAVAVAHREDADDAFYVNLVVAALDDPGAPVLSGDTIHGYADVPMSLPVFRVLSWELFQGAVARLVGLDGLTVAHLVAPIGVALLVPLAWARLAMRLLPVAWPWATAFALLGLLLAGDGRASHADFALLRLHQGKSVLLHVVLPLCAAHAIEFATAPGRLRLARLAASQIAAIGLSASGLWLAPVVAGIGLLAATPLDPRTLARRAGVLAVGLSASAYPVALALALRAATVRAVEEAVHPLEGTTWDAARLMEHATHLVFGDGPYRWLVLFCIVAATAAFGAPMLRRYAAASGAILCLLFFDPLTARLVANGITGADTYFRVFWLLPIPLFVGAVLAAPIRAPLPAPLASARARAILALAAAALVLGAAPRVHTLSPANGVRLAAPGPRLPPAELEAARTIAAHAGPEAFVLAPLAIARWIPLIQRHPRPLMAREMYMDRLHDRLGETELDRRRVLTHLVGGSVRPPAGAALLADAIARYPLRVVCLGGPALGWPEVRRVLGESPLEIVARNADHEIWARPAPARP